MYELHVKQEIQKKLIGRDMGAADLDFKSIHQITDELSKSAANDIDEHELFGALFSYSKFYPEDSKLCFELKSGFRIGTDSITTISELFQHVEKNTTTDFMVETEDGLRDFQLKRYKGRLLTEDVLDYIKKCIGVYHGALSDTNLLIQCQSPDEDISAVDFHEIHQKLTQMDMDLSGHIIFAYNESNAVMVMNTLYPIIGRSEVPIIFFSR